jgi:glycosyltransferase involved in cell wall biosynthesis
MRLLVLNMAMDLDTPSQEFLVAWVRRLAERVDRVEVITMRAGRVEVPANVGVHSLGKERGASEPRRVVAFYRHLRRLLREGPIDGCFSHMTPIFTVLAAPVLRPRGTPVVTWYAHPSLGWTLRVAHRLSSGVVTSVAPAYPYRRDKLLVVGQGIDTDLLAPDGTPPDRPPMILCVGRLSPVKDHATLFAAAATLRARWKEPFRVLVVGGPARATDEPHARTLRDRVRDLGLDDVVAFAGPMPMRSLPAWYRRSTVHVNLTPTGFGDKVAWEAMSCGRPSLAANDGFRETLGMHAERLLFRHGDADELAARLEWLLTRPDEELARMGADLRRSVVASHSLGRLADRLVEILQGLQGASVKSRAGSSASTRT